MSSINIAGDTSGSISLTVPSVAGTNTATLPAATGTVMVSGNMPAFSAYPSSNQTPSSATYTKVLFQTEEFDTNNNFASSTFTATIAGYYQFNLEIMSDTSNTRFIGVFYKNGSNYKVIGDLGSGGNTVTGSCLIQLNVSDYVEVYTYVVSGTPRLNGASNSTWLNGALVRTL